MYRQELRSISSSDAVRKTERAIAYLIESLEKETGLVTKDIDIRYIKFINDRPVTRDGYTTNVSLSFREEEI